MYHKTRSQQDQRFSRRAQQAHFLTHGDRETRCNVTISTDRVAELEREEASVKTLRSQIVSVYTGRVALHNSTMQTSVLC